MWISRSVLVWTYIITVIVACPILGLTAIRTIALFALQVGLLHQVTRQYSSRPTALAALRSRLFLCSTVGLVIYVFVFGFLGGVFSTVYAAFLWMRRSSITPQTEQEGFEAFFLEKMKHLQDDSKLEELPKIEYYALTFGACMESSLLQVITAYFLARGYLAMLVSGRDSHLVVRPARVYDVVTFAIVGALGLGIGGDSWTLFSVRLAQLSGQLPDFTSTIYEQVLTSVLYIVERMTHLAGQLLVATVFAERRVLGMPVRIQWEALRVWVVYVLFDLLNDVRPRWGQSTYAWLYQLGGVLCQVSVALYFGKNCWHRYSAAVEHDELKERTRQEARILSSREVM